MNSIKAVQVRRLRRQRHVRKRVAGTGQRPRLCVFRSSKHIYAQVVNDDLGVTLAAASTLEPAVRGQVSYGGNVAAATVLGQLIAERAKSAGVTKVCFDRRSYKYHGRVKALATAARSHGLDF